MEDEGVCVGSEPPSADQADLQHDPPYPGSLQEHACARDGRNLCQQMVVPPLAGAQPLQDDVLRGDAMEQPGHGEQRTQEGTGVQGSFVASGSLHHPTTENTSDEMVTPIVRMSVQASYVLPPIPDLLPSNSPVADKANFKKYVQMFMGICAMTLLILIGVALLATGGAFMHTTKPITITRNVTEFKGDTILLGRVSRETQTFAIELVCSNDLLSVDLFIDSGCNLQTYPNSISVEQMSVNSTTTTTTEVLFLGSSYNYIYLPLRSQITFYVEIVASSTTILSPVSLVVFDSYTNYINYLNSASLNTDDAYMVHKFNTEGSSTFTFFPGLENSYYFFAIESSAGTYFHYSYTGIVYEYNYVDYEGAKCNLPTKLCEKVNCTFSYTETETCILGYISPALSSRPFVNVRTTASQNYNFTNSWAIAVLVLGTAIILCGGVLLICVCVCVGSKKQLCNRSSESQPLITI